MKWTKPDGEIEFEGSGCCCPPGMRRGGQHTNSGTQWWRVTGKDWVRLHSGSASLRTLAEAANTCAEFEDALRDENRY